MKAKLKVDKNMYKAEAFAELIRDRELLDHYASIALSSFLSATNERMDKDPEEYSDWAYEVAYAMLWARRKAHTKN